jgi:TfoX/Sxy family transcriptional regulator of competence genes
MAYDEGIAQRLREALEGTPGITEKKMFGGVAFLRSGHMVCGVVRDALMVRVGPDAYQECLAMPYAREMDFTGRPLAGMIYVDDEGFAEDEDLSAWVARGLRFAATLPARKPATAQKKTPARQAAEPKRAGKKPARKRSAANKAVRKKP